MVFLSSLNKKFIGLAIVGGLIFGALTVTGITLGYENQILLALLAAVGIASIMHIEKRHYQHAFLGGALGLLSVGIVQMTFMPTYFANNPGIDSAIAETGFTPLQYLMIYTPIGTVIGGIIAFASAGFTDLVRFLIKKLSS